MTVKSGQAVTVLFATSHPTTGAATNGDALPTGTLYVNGTSNAAVVTVTNITTGVYKAALTLPSLTAGDVVSLRIAATVNAIAGEGVVWQEVADTERVSDLTDEVIGTGAGLTALGDTRLANLDAAVSGRAVAGEAAAAVAGLSTFAPATDEVETGITWAEWAKALGAVLAGVASGGGTTTVVFKALGNAGTTRVTATVDANGNRSAVTLNL